MPQLKKLTFGLKSAQKLLPTRKKNANKSHGGKALIIAGSEGMFGAAILAAKSASRMGAGYVTLFTDSKKFPVTKNPDFLCKDYKSNKIKDLVFNAVAIGPGLGKSKHALKLLKNLLAFTNAKVVVDADALNLCAENNIKELPPGWIITPHEAELARLLKVKIDLIKKDREFYAEYAQKKLHCTVLLKGHNTLIATPHKLFVVKSGNPSLAKAGTGDVLTGMICALVSQGLDSPDAAALAAYVHGYTADQWLRDKKDILSLMASDLVDMIPSALFKIRNS